MTPFNREAWFFVPVLKQQVSVTGAVRRPAKFEIFGGETLEEVVELAGGTEDNAFLDFIRLERIGFRFPPSCQKPRPSPRFFICRSFR